MHQEHQLLLYTPSCLHSLHQSRFSFTRSLAPSSLMLLLLAAPLFPRRIAPRGSQAFDRRYLWRLAPTIAHGLLSLIKNFVPFFVFRLFIFHNTIKENRIQRKDISSSWLWRISYFSLCYYCYYYYYNIFRASSYIGLPWQLLNHAKISFCLWHERFPVK